MSLSLSLSTWQTYESDPLAAELVSPKTVRHFHLWGAQNPEFFGHRLQTSIARVTVEDSTGVHRPNPPYGAFLWLVVYPSRTSRGMCTNLLAHRLQEENKPRMYEKAGRCLGLGHGQLPMIRAPWLAISLVSSTTPTSSAARQQQKMTRVRKLAVESQTGYCCAGGFL